MKTKTKHFHSLFIVLLTSSTFLLSTASAETNKSAYGYLEPVTLTMHQIALTAKLDTGAETASISAKNILLYEMDGQEYASFMVAHPELEQPVHYNLPIVQHAKIKKRASEQTQKSRYHSRPVVNMQIQFDGKPHTIMVNLIDRSHFSTPMLLGRKALKKLNAIVDSTRKNTLLYGTNS